jgi:hypothetical protein
MMNFLFAAVEASRARLLGEGLGKLLFTAVLLYGVLKFIGFLFSSHSSEDRSPAPQPDDRPGPPRFNG